MSFSKPSSLIMMFVCMLVALLGAVAAVRQVEVGQDELTYETGGWDVASSACGDVRYSSEEPGSQVSFTFKGTGIGLYLPMSPWGASIDVIMDGTLLAKGLNTTASVFSCDHPIYSTTGWGYRMHTVTVRSTDNGTLYVSKFVYNTPDLPTFSSPVTLPSPSSAIAEDDTNPSSKNKMPIVIGALVGGIVLLSAICVGAYFLYRRLKAKTTTLENNMEAAAAKNQDDDAASINSIKKEAA